MIGPDLSQRSTLPEFMDTESVSFAEFHDCLQTLSRINTFTLAYRPTLRWFDAHDGRCRFADLGS